MIRRGDRKRSVGRSRDLEPGSFASAGQVAIAGDGGVKTFTVPTSSLPRRFYQVQAGP